jgi:hypothetical protein
MLPARQAGGRLAVSSSNNTPLSPTRPQDVKQAEQDAKLAQLEAAVLAVLRVSEGIRDDLVKAGVVPAKS